MGKAKRVATDLTAFADGRDENNLAEFPIALLGDTVPDGLKTIEFEDTVNDWSTGEPVIRRVCITGSDKYGLPTAKDEDVLLALIQLTKIANDFTSPEVWFNKHQVIDILGWKNRGWAYDRVEEALHRWKGVSIHYWNAWRDRAKNSWCDSAAIGVIEYFAFSDGRRAGMPSRPGGQSRFAWNKVFFESFQAGYLKKLDFGTYRQLHRPAARRAFRFLDKRFYHSPTWEFELREFACEKLGFSRSYTTGQLKERLRPALGELQNIGFIEPVRYEKERPKQWTVSIAKKCETAGLEVVPAVGAEGVVEQLVRRGIEAEAAKRIVEEFEVERILEKLHLVDWLVAKRDKRSPKNPAGFLVAAIRDDYPLPNDYRKEFERKGKKRGSSCTAERGKGKASTRSLDDGGVSNDPVTAHINTLDSNLRQVLEEKALAEATALEVESYRRLKVSGGELFSALRESLLRKYVTAHKLYQSNAATAA